jgi:hypothetical protein
MIKSFDWDGQVTSGVNDAGELAEIAAAARKVRALRT